MTWSISGLCEYFYFLLEITNSHVTLSSHWSANGQWHLTTASSCIPAERRNCEHFEFYPLWVGVLVCFLQQLYNTRVCPQLWVLFHCLSHPWTQFFHKCLLKYLTCRRKMFYHPITVFFLCRFNMTYSVIQKLSSPPTDWGPLCPMSSHYFVVCYHLPKAILHFSSWSFW